MNFSKCITLDVECYVNYFLLMFKKVTTGEVIYFEKYEGSPELNRKNIYHLLNKYTLISFNGLKYDMLIIEAALAGYSNKALKRVSNMIIPNNKAKRGMQPWEVRKELGLAKLDVDHIDLIEVAPLKASLKMYSGRLHAKKMQDLPVHHSAKLSPEQMKQMIPYCENDNDATILLAKRLEKELDLRVSMGHTYGVDLRSKSDAQIAESVIKHELQKHYNITPSKPKFDPRKTYRYKTPKNIKFKTDQMQSVLRDIQNNKFRLNAKNGHVLLPESLSDYKFTLGASTYKIGLGGLHSCEKNTCHVAGKYLLKDYDVASYYPRIIINNRLTPEMLGAPFLKIYEALVDMRLKAKLAGDKVTADSIKITINGLFGKFGSFYSFVYAPNLMLQTTITGQLSLLMLVEMLTLEGIDVVSGNTDGIVVKMLPEQETLVEEIVFDWELQTDFEMEATSYSGLYSRGVNDYIAIKLNGEIKGKGAYADNRNDDGAFNLHINPANEICSEAVKHYLRDNTPIEKTITQCNDVSKFVTIRTVNGAAGTRCETLPPPKHNSQIELLKIANFKYDELVDKWFAPGSKAKTGMSENAAYKRAVKQLEVKQVSGEIGKAVRWYYGAFSDEPLYYMTSGNKVPRTDGAVPLMELPDNLPDDIDYDWYTDEAKRILKDIGVAA